MTSILQILSELNETNSVKVKEAILRNYADNALLKRVFYLALSPRVKFYIRKIPDYSPTFAGVQTLEGGLNLIEHLSARTITGSTAVSWLAATLAGATIADAIVLEFVIKKDLRCGVNSSTVNKVWPKLIEVTPYMGAIAFNKKKAEALFNKEHSKPVYSQVKMDGRYVNVIVDEAGNAEFESRTGETTYLGHAFDGAFPSSPNGFVLCGELTMDDVSRYDSNGIIASIVSINKKMENNEFVAKEIRDFEREYGTTFIKASEQIVLTYWDILTLSEYANGASRMPYHTRFQEALDMEQQMHSTRVRVVSSKLVCSLAEAMKDWQEAVSNGEEGTILKSYDCVWKHGKPNEQIKIKLQFDVDLKIIGFNQGKAGTRLENTLGSLICESEDHLLQADPGGIKDEMRMHIWANRDKLIGQYVEVTCCGVSTTGDGYGLLHPRFSQLRLDKSEGDTLYNIMCIEKGIKEITE